MIDLIALRNDPQKIISLLKKKDPSFDAEQLFNLDKQVRDIKLVVEELRHKKNELSQINPKNITNDIKEESRQLSKKLKEQEAELADISAKFEYLYLRCPNVIQDDVPAGNKDQNIVIKEFGHKPEFSFEPRNHVELSKINDWIDFDAAASMSGANFALYKGQCVKLIYNLAIYMFNNNLNFGYFPILPPYLVNELSLINASNFPRFKDDMYHIENEDLYLTPTSEVNLTNLYKNHIFLSNELPIRMTSWTSCFRKEAGGYGASERGLIRLHQFEKLELYTICEPKFSKDEQERMLNCAEKILQSLGLTYRISLLAAQDCSFPSTKTYDIEVWMPGQKVYKEVSSISNCSDFQSRRSLIRFRDSINDKTQLVYTLNGSSLALPRLMVALMETYQKEDGSIELPNILKSVTLNL